MSNDVEEGYYKTRAYKNGPWLPVRVWLEDGERCPDTNELLTDQKWKAEKNTTGDPFSWIPINPLDHRNIYWRKITKDQFTWITVQLTL